VVGGFVGSLIGVGGVDGVNIGSIIVAVIGAIVLLILFRVVMRKKA